MTTRAQSAATHGAAAYDRLLRAGALLPLGTPVEATPVGARRYTHPALGDRLVVRLVPEPIAPAEDLALETLDFANDGATAVALGQPRGLGFPASAILADPANASHALAVVKEMERFARMAKSKPGNAKDGFDEIGRRLARTVPHFLPSFYEQAGRAFLESGNPSQAAASFARAREMERTYNLPVDEVQRRQAFLEFALGGALTAKALSEYARALGQTNNPADTHAALKDLCVQRTLGGLPPWSGMAAELRRTAKAAGLDPAAEDAAILRELIDAPATARAAAGFWSSYRTAIVRLASDDPAFRGLLLNLHPTTGEYGSDFVEWWLALLREAGALEGVLHADGQPEAARAVGGPGAWYERTVRQAAGRYSWFRAPTPRPNLMALVAEMGPILRASDTPVQVFVNGSADVDLLDATLEAGIEIAEPAAGSYGGVHIDLRSYAIRPDRRPLNSLGGSTTLAPLVDRAVELTISEHGDSLAELPGLHPALRRWLGAQLEACTGGTLTDLAQAVFSLKHGATPRVRALDPETTRRIAATDVSSGLARTLRGGLVAELSWPALESVDLSLDDASVGGFAWPSIIVRDKRRAAVVGPGGVALVHDLRIPANAPAWSHAPMRYANEQLYVGWRAQEHAGYWSGRPGQVFEPRGAMTSGYWSISGVSETSIELPDGSRSEGAAPIHAGDTTAAPGRRVFSDGQTWWVMTEGGLREFDPETGRAGRPSRPRFLEEWVDDAWTLDLDASWLMPLPAGADGRVVGGTDGLIGARVRRREVGGANEWQVESVGGHRFEGRIGDGAATGFAANRKPVGLLLLPGDDAPRVVTQIGDNVAILGPGGAGTLLETRWGTGRGSQAHAFHRELGPDTDGLRDGVPFLPPPRFWFAYRPRDEATSRALRDLSDETARKLFVAVSADLLTDPQGKRLPESGRALAKAFPGLPDGPLRDSLLGALVLAGQTARRLGELGQPVDAKTGPAAAAPAADATPAVRRVVDDAALRQALSGLLAGQGYSYGGPGGRPLEQIEQVGAVMDRGGGGSRLSRLFGRQEAAAPSALASTSVSWYETVGRLGAVAYRAALPTTSDDDRATLIAFLRAMAANRFTSHAADIRLLSVLQAERAGTVLAGASLTWTDDRALFLGRNLGYSTAGVTFGGMEWARGGSFKLERELTLVEQSRPGRGWGDEAAIERFAGELERRGPIPWDPTAADIVRASTGLSGPAASLLLAGLPRIDNYENNFLPSETRELIGLKVAEARTAANDLKGLTTAQRLAVLDAAMPGDPAEVWTSGLRGAAERIAAAWVREHGQRVAIDDELAVEAGRRLAFQGSPPDPLRLVADAADPRMGTVPPPVIESGWSNALAPPEAFSQAVVRSLAITIPWLHAAAAAGDPLLARLPDALGATRRMLAEPDLFLPLGSGYVEWPRVRDVLGALGAQPFKAPRNATVNAPAVEVGPFVIAPHGSSDYARSYLRPARLAQGAPAAVVAALEPGGRALLESCVFLAGPGAEAIAARAAGSPLPAGAWEADPVASAPDVVARVEASLGVGREAARLFLQLLALPAPTKAAVLRWNGWTPASLTKASKPLVDAGLAVKAQRPRAGRDLFVPGPWATLPAPDLPVEAWKLALYGAELLADGSVAKPLDRLVAREPLHELFGRAWARWEAGDRPVFEQPPSRGGR